MCIRSDIIREKRKSLKAQEPKTIWFTGLSGSGKSTLANGLEETLLMLGKHTMVLDGDNIRCGLNKDLGFDPKDRKENIRRIAEVSKLMNDAGLICLVAFISPFDADRKEARRIIGNCFIEIYLSTPLGICEKKDIKGLYKKARNGIIPNFTGISSPYEVPQDFDVEIDTSRYSFEESIDKILKEVAL